MILQLFLSLYAILQFLTARSSYRNVFVLLPTSIGRRIVQNSICSISAMPMKYLQLTTFFKALIFLGSLHIMRHLQKFYGRSPEFYGRYSFKSMSELVRTCPKSSELLRNCQNSSEISELA